MLQALGFVALLALGNPSPVCHAEEATVRIAWGGGAAKMWKGQISVTGGAIASHRSLGLSPASPGALEVTANAVLIQQRTPQAYDGIDLTIRPTAGGDPGKVFLDIELALAAAPQPASPNAAAQPAPTQIASQPAPLPVQLRVTLAEVMNANPSLTLDEDGNKLLVRRGPGDWLRLQADDPTATALDAPERGPLIFAPETRLRLTPSIVHSVFANGASCRLKAQLRVARGGGEVWSDELAFVPDEHQSAKLARPIEFVLPRREGVYDLVFHATVKRIVGTPFRRDAVQIRRIQLVVLGGAEPPQAETPWRLVDQFDPANPTWRQWVNRLPGVSYLPGFDPAQPLGNGKMDPVQHGDREWVQLKPGGWQSFPLPTGGHNHPHLVEVDYPADLTQSLGVSVLQANLAGVLAPPNVDAGIHAEPVAGEAGVRRLRLIFWPGQAPMLMLTNRRDTPAIFGKIRVYSGGTRLPGAGSGAPGGRLAATYFDKPLFPENFSADEGLDSTRRMTLDDWLTFYHGASRLCDYLRFTGYNAAIVNVAREGGSLFPSETLEPTPKFDSGVFFIDGQDPQQKDVLELMFRLFDRAKLRLIPSIHFSGALPALERARRSQPIVGLELIGAQGTPLNPTNGAPAYNPLHPQVREAMRAVVAELVAKYGHHPSFAGVSIQLDPDSYALLPNEFWGLDDDTVERFRKATGFSLDSDPAAATAAGQGDVESTPRGASSQVTLASSGGAGDPQRFSRRAANLRGNLAELWIDWRAQEMTKLFQALATEVRRHRLDTRLVLTGARMFDGTGAQRALAPHLLRAPPIEATARRLGVDAQLLRETGQGIILLQPDRELALATLPEMGQLESLGHTEAMRGFFGKASTTGSPYGVLLFQDADPLRLPEFDQVSPFGQNQSYTQLRTILTPGGPHGRRRFARQLADNDHQWIVHGGDMVGLGHEDFLRPWLQQFTALPEAPFTDVKPPAAGDSQAVSQHQPVVVRQATVGQRTCVYLVNESPWTVQAKVRLKLPAGATAMDAAGQPLAPLNSIAEGVEWAMELEPYGLRVAWLGAVQAGVTDWQVTLPDGVIDRLRHELNELRDRAQKLQTPQPLRALVNGDFEQAAAPARTSEDANATVAIPGWRVVTQSSTVALDTNVQKSGKQSLRLNGSGNGQAHVVSDPFTVPATGKLYVFAWMRVASEQPQPKLRVMIRGDDGYYSYLYVGAEQGFPLSTEWKNGFLFPFDQIPPQVKQLTLEFSLLGPGEVWIDGVSPLEYWFTRSERNKLITDIGRLGFNLEHQVGDSMRFLDGYWATFLLNHVAAPPKAVAQAPDGKPASRKPVDRIRDLVPPLKFPRIKR
ncbi:MAG: family 10 glycosylhydrolase [Planctomycetales bacterium]|nr:family 10 glycosylhydrolase [Planctomycetales bacterium]